MKATYKIGATLAGAVLLITLVVAVSLWAFRQTESAAEARQHTYALIIRADALLFELTEAETSQRGYSLTGDEVFLAPYLAVRDGIGGHLNELRPLTANGDARKHLDALVPLVRPRWRNWRASSTCVATTA